MKAKVTAVPRDILLRYATLFSGTFSEAGMSADEYSAVESIRARKMPGCGAGIPTLGFYLAAMLYCMKRTIRVYRRTRGDPNQIVICRMAATLFMALTIYTICGAFGNYSYSFHFPVRLQMRSATPTLHSQLPKYVRNSRLRNNRG